MKIRLGSGAYSGLAALFSLLPSAQASISTYSDLSAWQADNPSSTVQDFNSIASGNYNPYSTPTDGTIQTTYSGNGGSGNAGVNTSSSPSFGTAQYLEAGTDSYSETYYDGGYTEYYGYYTYYTYGCGFFDENTCYNYYWVFGSDPTTGVSNTSYNQAAAIVLTPPTGTTALGFEIGQAYSNTGDRNITATVTTADNDTQTLTENNVYGTLSFFGFDASDPITSVVITEAANPAVEVYYNAGSTSSTTYYNDGLGPNTGYYYYVYNPSYENLDESTLAFDNLMYPDPAPEPASFLLLATAVLGVWLVMRKKLRWTR